MTGAEPVAGGGGYRMLVRPPGADASAPGRGPGPLLLPVLALATGAMDVLSLVGLGGVFTSVMTGNLVLVGDRAGRAGAARSPLGRFAGVLGLEAAVMAGFSLGWVLTGGRPDRPVDVLLIATAAVAMGLQGAAVASLHLAGVSTTYLTGTLTAMLSAGPDGRDAARKAAIVVALAIGAATGGLLVLHARAAAPLFPLAALAAVLAVLVVDPVTTARRRPAAWRRAGSSAARAGARRGR